MNPNSMLYWFPKICDLGIPIPVTYFAETPEEANQAANKIGYPVFLRTDLCAGKHDWKYSCFVESEDDIWLHVDKILELNERWRMLGINPKSLVVREFLDLETSFSAFSGDMPINKERRYFIQKGAVVCHHPYWPEDAFNQHPARMTNDSDWRNKLAALNEESGEEILTEYAERVSRVLPEYWSVDFAKAKNGNWYLLDMALGQNSYHWTGCPAKL